MGFHSTKPVTSIDEDPVTDTDNFACNKIELKQFVLASL